MKPDIIKVDGTIEPFDGSKLDASLRKATATVITAERIRLIFETMILLVAKSFAIYRREFQMFRRDARSAAARYSLRRALFEFGPSGHPCEYFVAEIFIKEGWIVEGR